MKRCTLARRVVREVDEIATYTVDRWGQAQAIRYISDLQDRFAWLAENPLLGKTRDEIRPGLRSYRQGSHVIFYRETKSGITIIGVPHASMDFEAYFD